MNDNILKRYTDITALLYLLRNRAITLLDPKSWDDSNDSHSLFIYKKKLSLCSLLALCFTETPETYHHWHVFAGGSGGVCITFWRDKLIEIMSKIAGIRHSSVKYLTLPEMRNNQTRTEDLPFIKRYGYQDEMEYRIIYQDQADIYDAKDIIMPLSCIERITLSPWLPEPLITTTKETIKNIKGCKDIKVIKSTLVGNKEWKKLTSRAS